MPTPPSYFFPAWPTSPFSVKEEKRITKEELEGPWPLHQQQPATPLWTPLVRRRSYATIPQVPSSPSLLSSAASPSTTASSRGGGGGSWASMRPTAWIFVTPPSARLVAVCLVLCLVVLSFLLQTNTSNAITSSSSPPIAAVRRGDEGAVANKALLPASRLLSLYHRRRQKEETRKNASDEVLLLVSGARRRKRFRAMKLVNLLGDRPLTVGELLGPNPRNAAAVCELFLIGHPQCRIAHGEEDMFDCIGRFGYDDWTRVLQPQCTGSSYWRSLRGSTMVAASFSTIEKDETVRKRALRLDPVAEAHLGRDDDDYRLLTENRSTTRSYGLPHPPLQCSYGPVYPLGFCAPSSMFFSPEGDEEEMPPLFPKLFEWFPTVPSRFPPAPGGPSEAKKKKYMASRGDEYVMMMVQRLSMFAWTHMRGGPDCLRHHEILASGGVPYFADLGLLPPERVSMLPRDVLMQVPSLPGVSHIGVASHPFNASSSSSDDGPYFYRLPRSDSLWNELRFWDADPHLHLFLHMNFRKLGDVDWDTFDLDRYEEVAVKLMDFTRKHLACHAVAAYVLKVLGKESPRRVMYVGTEKIDYQSVLLEMGLAELRIPYSVHKIGQHHRRGEGRGGVTKAKRSGDGYAAWLESDQQRGEDYYGLGFGTSHRVPLPPVIDDEDVLCAALRRGEFDVWIYSHPWPKSSSDDNVKKFVCFDDVVALVKAKRIAAAFVDGGDGPSASGFPGLAANGIVIFAREASC